MVAATAGEAVVPSRIAREAYCVPESKNAFQLLEDMRFRRAPLAVILDEYGGVAGLVTMEDLIEQLIGPIHDEHDAPAADDPVVPLGDSAFEVDAGVELEELNERFGVHLPTDEEYQTIGGLALHALGRLPEPGATFRRDGVEFTVLAVGDRSIKRIKMDLEPAPETAPGV
jgi:CBS domain containing-hemolysin-like protein